MSNNTKRRGDVEDKDQIEYRIILEKLLKDPENKKCADCGTAAPRWASATLGVFLCIKCSGVHRAMGTHISFIRSVSLDRWKPEEIALIQSMGNANAALIWEAKLPAEYRRPSTNDAISLEKFIRDKYEHKRYYKPPAVDKAATGAIKLEAVPGTPVAAHPGVLQPPNRSPLTVPGGPRPNAPQRTNPNTPIPPSSALLVDPFSAVSNNNNKTITSTPLPQTLPQSAPQSASLFPAEFPGPQTQQQTYAKPVEFQPPAVDVNLLKKSNIMSMFDVQTEQQKQQQQQQQQQMLLQQQMYFSASPQLYYTTSGGLVPVMYGAQSYGPATVVYPQHFQ